MKIFQTFCSLTCRGFESRQRKKPLTFFSLNFIITILLMYSEYLSIMNLELLSMKNMANRINLKKKKTAFNEIRTPDCLHA